MSVLEARTKPLWVVTQDPSLAQTLWQMPYEHHYQKNKERKADSKHRNTVTQTNHSPAHTDRKDRIKSGASD